jgi:hypothetical protein
LLAGGRARLKIYTSQYSLYKKVAGSQQPIMEPVVFWKKSYRIMTAGTGSRRDFSGAVGWPDFANDLQMI